MNNEPLPRNCITLKAAAEQFSLPYKKLLQEMRERGWLHQGKHKKDHKHNKPTRAAIEYGWLKTQMRGYPAPYNKQVTLSYEAVVITTEGFIQLANQLSKPVKLIPAVQQPTDMLKSDSEGKRYAAIFPDDKKENFFNSTDDAHDAAIAQMREWGLVDKVG